MSDRLRQAVLSLGLEDLIPLPEIAGLVRKRELVAPEAVVSALSSEMIALLQEGLIQVWAGPWPETPEALSRTAARDLLAIEGHYEWNSQADLVRRVYYVNVENVRTDVV